MLIVHFLRSLFKLYYTDKMVYSEKLIIYNKEYWNDIDSKANNGFLGFFDWLRVDKNAIMGLRLCFFEHQYYNNLLQSFSYVHPTFDHRCMEYTSRGILMTQISAATRISQIIMCLELRIMNICSHSVSII